LDAAPELPERLVAVVKLKTLAEPAALEGARVWRRDAQKGWQEFIECGDEIGKGIVRKDEEKVIAACEDDGNQGVVVGKEKVK
jgi:hypothetical protein